MAKSTTARSATPKSSTTPTLTEEGPREDALARHRDAARKLSPKEVVGCRVDVLLAQHNVREGVATLLAERPTFEADPDAPRVDWEVVAAVPDLAAALVLAATECVPALSDKTLRGRIGECFDLRALLLGDAQTLVRKGLLPGTKVAAIERGTGSFDAAADCVALAKLYAANATALRGKTAVSAADVRRAGALGAELLAELSPGGARRKSTVPAEARDLRDRLWTMLLGAYRRLEQLAGYRWGRALPERFPALQTRAAKRRVANPAEG